MELKNMDIAAELWTLVDKELEPYLRAREPELDLPKVQRSRDLSQGDVTLMFAGVCAKRKCNPKEFTASLAVEIQAKVDAALAAGKKTLVSKVVGAGPYFNIFLNRAVVYGLVIKAVQRLGSKFGHLDDMKGKSIVVEHTSSNPNAPLHIGNLRNTMIGAHLGNLLNAVGYDAKQHFYVNDLGAQIGLTALAYSRCYHLMEPKMKVDHWIGSMYAIMNTFTELQKLGVDIGAVGDAHDTGKEAIDAISKKYVDGAADDEEKKKGILEYLDIFQDLRDRSPEHHALFQLVLQETRTIEDIKLSAGQLNLSYERQEPAAINIFRKMVTDCLCGVQQTMETYGVQHDQFDFESELGWEGSNQKFLEILRKSPYFIPQTNCNDQGVPQGAYIDFTSFIADQNLPTGKRGYQKIYPPLYVLRPDGSTLYTFRDVVYSFKKAANKDMVLNIICSEQDLAQQKVSLAMYAMNPELLGKQYHVSYDLVKLTSGKMSGRRGRYLLADDLYSELKAVIVEKMRKKYVDKGEDISQEQFEAVTHEVAAASMKYALLSCSCHVQINFDIAKVTDFEDASAPFILYNSTRLTSLINKFHDRVKTGEVEKLPPLENVDLSLLDNQIEWELLLDYVLNFGNIIRAAACPTIPAPPQLPEYGTHKVCDFLNYYVRALSSYYGPKGVRILPTPCGKHGGGPAMYARIHLCNAFKQVIDNGLKLLMINPLEKM